MPTPTREARHRSPATHDERGQLRRSLVVLMAVATGLAVASLYYAQPLLPAIGRSLRLGAGTAGLIVTIGQVGYACGLAFVLPLGDLFERRRLVVVLSLAAAGGLVWAGLSPGAASLLPATFAVGVVSVMAQVLVPFAASLAAEEERGRVVGMVMSGLLLGVLLARTVAGLVAEVASWRAVYLAAAAAMLVQAVVLGRRLPAGSGGAVGTSYGRLLASAARLARDEPLLRLRALYGFLGFGTFSVLWTSIAFLLARHYHYSTVVIGLFGLAGAAGAATATIAGRMSDRNRAELSTGVATGLLLAAWLAIWLGRGSVAWLLLGIVVLDVGVQGLQITNQGEIYRLDAGSRSRLTAAYMVIYFAGGALGSAISATLYASKGWDGVCAAGAAFGAAAFVVFLGGLARRRRLGHRIGMPAGAAPAPLDRL